jgi:hypothetical protein
VDGIDVTDIRSTLVPITVRAARKWGNAHVKESEHFGEDDLISIAASKWVYDLDTAANAEPKDAPQSQQYLELREQFKDWLTQNPLHKETFVRLEIAWRLLHCLPRVVWKPDTDAMRPSKQN